LSHSKVLAILMGLVKNSRALRKHIFTRKINISLGEVFRYHVCLSKFREILGNINSVYPNIIGIVVALGIFYGQN